MADRICSIEGCLIRKRVYRYTHEDAVAIMRAAGLEPVDPYPGSTVAWPCICLACGAEVSPRLNGITAGQGGCRACADRRNGERQRGPGNPAWRGNSAEYFAVHHRIRAQRGRATDQLCVDCGQPAAKWSYDGGSPLERISQAAGSEGLRFSPEIEAYSPRCDPCHTELDGIGKYPRSGGDA